MQFLFLDFCAANSCATRRPIPASIGTRGRLLTPTPGHTATNPTLPVLLIAAMHARIASKVLWSLARANDTMHRQHSYVGSAAQPVR
jgi:hypothetical protein